MAKNRLTEAIANPGRQPFVFIFVITLVLGIAANGLSSLVLDTLGESAILNSKSDGSESRS
ncbi:MAG: hypothetical protein NT070_19190 [Cyanobacteria bacterium]|nr:hypothetical protein [Cyanobacteriota bacterium]